MKMRFVIAICQFCLLFPALTAAYEAEGLASWYGGHFHGRKTASGEIFDTFKLTAAHRTLPFGTLVLVTNLDNGRQVEVRINDRGPFIRGRIIDLSRAAADAIGLTPVGVVRVRIEAVGSSTEPAPPTISGPVPESTTVDIQVGSFSSKDNARRLAAALELKGFQPNLEEHGPLTRVLLRNVEKDRVEEVRHRLAEVGFRSVLVKSPNL